MTDYEYQKTLMIGTIIGACITLLAFYMLKPSPENRIVTLEKDFAIVDTYKGCDIVQWDNGSFAEYKYFLHCNNTRPVYGEK
jgi:hypothetical protein